jgi:hypothetical protein
MTVKQHNPAFELGAVAYCRRCLTPICEFVPVASTDPERYRKADNSVVKLGRLHELREHGFEGS